MPSVSLNASPFDVIFTARPGVDIFEIWGSDGTEAGTQLIKNIRPGKRADIGPYKGFIKAGSRFLFAANDGINGRELWRTDGTSDGTYMLKDLNGQPLVEGYCTLGNAAYPMCSPMCNFCVSNPFGPECQLPYPMGCSIGSGSSNISDYDFVTTGTKAFFFVDNDNYGGSQDELWVSDGTAEGTQLVRSFASIGGQTMALAGNRIFFTANDGSGHGGELWVSDGTAGGTYLVKDINPGSGWSNSGPITGFGNKVVFAADDGAHGKEPWISDGTEAGTYMIKDLVPGAGSPDPRPFAAVGSKVAFMANVPGSGPELWVTDGTPDNVTLIDIQPGSGGSIPGLLTTIDNKLWFTANDGVHGREPWIFDGNAATMLKDINLGTADGISPSSNPGFAKGHDGRVYFQAKGEIWTSDGTEAGTQMLKSIEAGLFAPAGSVTYFTAFDGQVTGSELWKTDGTEAGTVLVKDIWAGSGSSYPAMITAIEVAPDIEVSPASYDFGNVLWGQTSTAMFTISNVGSGELTLSAISLSNALGVFSITSAPSLPKTLAAGQSATVEVTFSPKAIQPYTGSLLNIVSNDTDEPSINISLSGRGALADTPSEQVEAVTNYIQDSVAAGELTGVGSGNSADKKVQALINMIEAAGDLLEAGQTTEGCQQLADIYLKVDGLTPPPDFVTGPAREGLASAIQGLRTYYGCQ